MSCFKPTTQQELSEWIVKRGDSQQKIQWLCTLGQQDELSLDLSGFKQVIDYPFRDMTITIETGMTVSQLQKVLEEHQQWLPVNVPHPETTTLAEVICKNWFGSLSAGYGTMRDWLLGVTAIDGRGRIFHAGGRVVKNVAGYDLCKLLVGSNGELAIPVVATLQVKPQPQQILVHQLKSKTIEGLKTLWLTLRNLPFNPVVFDAISTDEYDDNNSNMCLLCAVEGTKETTQSLSDQIKQTIDQHPDTELTSVQTWTSELDPWIVDAENWKQSVILRIGSLPSQTIDVLDIASKHHLSGFGQTTRGVCILRSVEAAETAEGEERIKSFLAKLSSLNANYQCLSGHQIPMKNTHSQEKAASRNSLIEKIKSEFDPQKLF